MAVFDGIRAFVNKAVNAVSTYLGPQSFEQRGEVWPDEGDAARIALYRQYEQLYRSNHEAVYEPGRSSETGTPYVSPNLLGELSDLVAARLMGEPPTVEVTQSMGPEAAPVETPEMPEGTVAPLAPEAPETPAETPESPEVRQIEAVIEQILAESDWEALCAENATSGSYCGDSILKAIYDPELDAVRIVTVRPDYWFPEWGSEDGNRMVACELAWWLVEPAEDAAPNDADAIGYLRVERHEPGLVTNRLYQAKRNFEAGGDYPRYWRMEVALDAREETADVPPSIATGVEGLLVVHVPNLPTPQSRPWGRSDYERGESLQRDISHRRTKIAERQDQCNDPWIAVPSETLDENGNLNVANKIIPYQQDQELPQYIVYPGNTEDDRAEVKDLQLLFFLTSGISPESAGFGEGPAAESGRAIRLRQVLTTSTVAAKARYWRKGLRQIISVATKLWAQQVSREPRLPRPAETWEIGVTFGDGLPPDEFETIQNATTLFAAGLASPETALKMVHPDWPEAEVRAEIERLDAQTAKTAAQFAPPPIPGTSGSPEIAAEGGLEQRVAAKTPFVPGASAGGEA